MPGAVDGIGEPEITPVRAAHRFDERALASFLDQRLGGTAALRVAQFEGGQSNPTFLIERGAERLVLRKKPPGQAAALGAPGGPRVPRDDARCARATCRCPRRSRCAGRRGARHRVLRDAPRAGPRDRRSAAARTSRPPSAPRSTTTRRACSRRCTRSIPSRSGSPTSAGPATTTRARSRAGAGSTSTRRPKRSPSMEALMEWLPANVPESDETRHRARRLPDRELHPGSDRAEDRRRARLGALHTRPPARRSRLLLSELPRRGDAGQLARRRGPCSDGDPGRRALRRALLRVRGARRRSTTGRSTWCS